MIYNAIKCSIPIGVYPLIIPHLLFAHFVGDYLLQTDWLVVRKSQSWDGLLLHGFIVFVMSLLAVAVYLDRLLLPVCVLFVLHTAQDWLKVWVGRHIRLHLAWSYFADQFLHWLTIVGIQLWVGNLETTTFEVLLFSFGSALIIVTRFYEVSWWGNWFEMIVYMHQWGRWAYLERLAMLLVAMWGALPALLALTFGLPRLYWAWHKGNPLWRQKYGIIEWGLGIVLSVAVGYIGIYPLWQP